jgi:hypothetical protein
MPPGSKICPSLGLCMLVVFATPAFAQTFGHTEVFLSSAAEGRVVTFLGASAPPRGPAAAAGFDYALFATELIAYLTKEMLHDSMDEYGNLLPGSHRSATLPERRSEFATHCLEVVTQLGSAVQGFGSDSPDLVVGPPSALEYAARAGTAALALRQVWTALSNDVEAGRPGFSLKPKVAAGRFAINLTLRW